MSTKSKSKALPLGALDWDDTELIRAYEKSMNLKGDGKKNETKASQAKWKVGDFCTALYQGDNSVYEAKIISLDEDNYCTIKFLGYEDLQEVELDSLRRSRGGEARKAQVARAKEYNNAIAEVSYNESEENETSDVPESSPERPHLHRKRNASSAKRSPTADMTLPTPSHYPTNAMYPMVPLPPMPVPDAACGDSSFDNMCSAWYLAGYYTGLHQAEKMCKDSHSHGHKRCCCHH